MDPREFNGSPLGVWDPFRLRSRCGFEFLGLKPPPLPRLQQLRASYETKSSHVL